MSTVPSLHLGKRFRSPKKLYTARGIRAAKRLRFSKTPPGGESSKTTSSPSSSIRSTPGSNIIPERTLYTTSESETYLSDISRFDIPQQSSREPQSSVIVDTALLSRIEFLESELARYRSFSSKKKEEKKFCIQSIANNDSLILFYTGFQSYEIFLAFFHFLGPSTSSLIYWGDKDKDKNKSKRKRKLDAINQLFLTLTKLKLNLKVQDMALRFGISIATVSNYFITWICFLYCHLREIEWMPDARQVLCTLPVAFKESYKNTFSIIDATEIFIETPTDLQLQSSTWSSYKHHNTGKILVSCTPNGAISFVSDLYMGAISDVELTRVSGFIEKLHGKSDGRSWVHSEGSIKCNRRATKHTSFYARTGTFTC